MRNSLISTATAPLLLDAITSILLTKTASEEFAPADLYSLLLDVRRKADQLEAELERLHCMVPSARASDYLH